MTAIDIIILAIVLLAAVLGAVKGLVHQVGTIAGVVCAVLVCRFFGGTVADYIVDAGSEHAGVYRTMVYVLVFVAVFAAVQMVARLFSTALGKMHVRILDRVAGAIFSGALSVLAMSLLLNIYLAVAPDDRPRFDTPGKPWRTAVLCFAPKVLGYITTDAGK
ncbi:MAG: CvpA family protein [Muribaculaceae bacterium]|nr:CvpA family protein [Muribaculaceae bacterium]